MARKRGYRAVTRVDPKALAEFRAGIRKRYTDEQILDQLRDCAKDLGRSPTMREFERHDGTTVHPQTVIERFGSWNAAKREAGLVPRRFATKAGALALPAAARRSDRPRADVQGHRRASRARALEVAVLAHVRIVDERAAGGRVRRTRGRGTAGPRNRPGRDDGPAARPAAEVRRLEPGAEGGPALLTEWQVYRMFDAQRGAWATFQYLVRERLREDGADVAADGTVRG